MSDESFVCAACGNELPIRPSVVTGVADAGTKRQLCIACWSAGESLDESDESEGQGTALEGYRGP